MLTSVKGRLSMSYSCLRWLSRNVLPSQCVRNASGCCQQEAELLPKREADFGKTLLNDVAPVQLDLDLGSQLSNPKELERNVRLRGMDHININRLAKEYMEFKMMDLKKKELEKERKDISEGIQKLRREKENIDGSAEKRLTEHAREVRDTYKSLVSKFNSLEQKMTLAALRLPNNLSPDTSDTEYEVLQEYTASGSKKNHSISHMDISQQENLIKLSDIGDRACYFQGKLAEVEQDLIQEFCNKLNGAGFTQLTSMEMFRDFVMEGCGIHLEDSYKIKQFGDTHLDQFIRGNSAMSFAAFLTKMLISTELLPLKLFTIGRSYQPVSSDSAQFPAGLLSTTQSIKASMLYTCASEESAVQSYQEAQSLLWDIYTNQLAKHQMNARLALVPVKDLALSEQSRVDLQIWLPSHGQYLTVASVSYIGDYISRRLTIRQNSDIKTTKSSSLVHMVYGEMLNVNRLIAILLEHGFT